MSLTGASASVSYGSEVFKRFLAGGEQAREGEKVGCILDGSDLSSTNCIEERCCWWDRAIMKCVYIETDQQQGMIMDKRDPEKEKIVK